MRLFSHLVCTTLGERNEHPTPTSRIMTKTPQALARRPVQSLTVSIETRIFMIRGQKVIVDSDLADLYRVPTKVFNQGVKRNFKRFPKDFMFRLTE